MLICFLSLFRKKETIQHVLHLFQEIWWFFQDFFSFFLYSTVCSLYRRDQEVCKVILNNLLPVAVGLAQFDEHAAEEAGSAKGQFLTVVEAFWYVI